MFEFNLTPKADLIAEAVKAAEKQLNCKIITEKQAEEEDNQEPK
jgi:hypothetical protein